MIESIQKRRSIRKYKSDQAVSKEQLDRLLEAVI